MAIHDRTERFAKIRAWLGGPLPQAPNPHKQLNQMLKDEQELNLRLSNSHQAWALTTKTFNSVVDTTEYTITADANSQQPGKVYFVTRATGNADLPYVTIPFDDYNNLDYGKMPLSVNSALYVPEKISFYRLDLQAQTIKAVLQPTPQEVMTYMVYLYTGSLDRAQAAMNKSGPVTELVDWLDIKSSLALLPYTEWRLGTDDFNTMRRKELAAGLQWQYAELKPTVDEYIRQINAPKSFDMDYWDD